MLPIWCHIYLIFRRKIYLQNPNKLLRYFKLVLYKCWCSQETFSCLMQVLGKQMDPVFSHGVSFCIKKCALKSSSYQFPFCYFMSRNCKYRGRSTFHCVYHLIRKCLPYFCLLHTLFLGLSFSFEFCNLKMTCESSWSWTWKMWSHEKSFQ